ncbi:hypothetical protein FRC07_014859 [Ceratobasidium sp. 392]|nr:hypothetical protein FRC07_014859 [Ceratobasidium sp. 392]
MSLLKWMTLGTVQSATSSPAASSSKNVLPAPSTSAAPPESGDPALATARWNHKRFGMENLTYV